MNNLYLIPANSKKGQLLFNLFRPVDLVVFLTGVALSIIFFLAINSSTIGATIIKLIPIGIGTLLVVPLPNYHNVMMFLGDMWEFITNRRVYLWKGWCVRSEYGEEKK